MQIFGFWGCALPEIVIFFARGNSLSQNLTVLTAPSGREPLAHPRTLHFSRKLYRCAKGSIPEDDFPRPGEDVAQRQKGESVERSETEGVCSQASVLALSGANAPALPKGEPLAKPDTLRFSR